jgi:MFS family permease
MYTLIRESLSAVKHNDARPARSIARSVTPTVILLGLTSFFTDISSEMVMAVLPLYFIGQLSLTPVHYGVIDGLYQGASAPMRLMGAYAADRWQRHKEIATVGYGLSTVSRLGILIAGGLWLPVTGFLLLDRAGKGIRTAPRDALISLNSSSPSMGFSFGIHRAFDTCGALVGPLVAFGLLQLAPNAFSMIFVVSFCFGVIGLAVIGLLVRGQDQAVTRLETPPSAREAIGLLANPRFLSLTLVAGALALFTISDGFLYLVLQRRLDLDIGLFPLLYIGTACAYLVAAIPAGWLADKVGRGRVFAGGYVLLLICYTALLRPVSSPLEIAFYLALLGGYYAATDGVLMAIASVRLPEALRASGLALITTTTGLGRLAGSVMFSLVWTWQGSETAIALMLAGLLMATLTTTALLVRKERVPDAGAIAD